VNDEEIKKALEAKWDDLDFTVPDVVDPPIAAQKPMLKAKWAGKLSKSIEEAVAGPKTKPKKTKPPIVREFKFDGSARNLAKVAAKVASSMSATMVKTTQQRVAVTPPGIIDHLDLLVDHMHDMRAKFKLFAVRTEIARRRMGVGKLDENKAHKDLRQILDGMFKDASHISSIGSVLYAATQDAAGRASTHKVSQWLEVAGPAKVVDHTPMCLHHLRAMRKKYQDRFLIDVKKNKITMTLVVPPHVVHDKEMNIRMSYPECRIVVRPDLPMTEGARTGNAGIMCRYKGMEDVGRPHPHIYRTWTCFGDYQGHVGSAYAECRWLDVFEMMEQLTIDPKTHSDIHYLYQFANLDGCECECVKCKKWFRANSPGILYPTDVCISKVSKWTCQNCVARCPVSDRILDDPIVIDGVAYHKSVTVAVGGVHTLKTDTVLDRYSKKTVMCKNADVCAVTGIMGTAYPFPESYDGGQGNPFRMFKLKGGVCVIEACLDLIDEEGKLISQGEGHGSRKEASSTWWHKYVKLAWAGLDGEDPNWASRTSGWSKDLWKQLNKKAS